MEVEYLYLVLEGNHLKYPNNIDESIFNKLQKKKKM
jgi:hypothetical protein